MRHSNVFCEINQRVLRSAHVADITVQFYNDKTRLSTSCQEI